MTDTLLRVLAPHMVAGAVVRDGCIVRAAPILRWTIGKPPDALRRWAARKHSVTVEEYQSMPETAPTPTILSARTVGSARPDIAHLPSPAAADSLIGALHQRLCAIARQHVTVEVLGPVEGADVLRREHRLRLVVMGEDEYRRLCQDAGATPVEVLDA